MSDLTTEKREYLLNRIKEIDAELDRSDHWGTYYSLLIEERKHVVNELRSYYGINPPNPSQGKTVPG